MEIIVGLSAVDVIREVDNMSSSEAFNLTKTQRYDPRSQKFGRFGYMYTLDDGTIVKDSRELFRDLSPAATWLLWEMDMIKDVKTNYVLMYPTKMTVGDKAKYYRGIQELEEKGIVLKVKRGTFFINPYVLFPWNDVLDQVRAAWNELHKTVPHQEEEKDVW